MAKFFQCYSILHANQGTNMGLYTWGTSLEIKIKNQEKIALSKTRFFLLLFMEE